jgi:lantibiotic modifying enzyme
VRAVGIALSRLRTLPYTGPGSLVSEEIGAALDAVDAQLVAAHCLCHGELGNAEVRLQAARVLDRPDLLGQARQRVLDIVADVGTTGWRCGLALDVQTPGLMHGMAGIGYGLLRLTDPDRVAVVLTLQPGTP